MATLLENLKTRRDAVAAELAALSTSAAGGLPNAVGEGVNVDHQGYKKSLYEELEKLNDLILKYQGVGIVESREYAE